LGKNGGAAPGIREQTDEVPAEIGVVRRDKVV
jgi:hypothetical protein